MHGETRWDDLIDLLGDVYAIVNSLAVQSAVDASLYDGLPLNDQIRQVFAQELEYRPEVDAVVEQWIQNRILPEMSAVALRFFSNRLLNATILLGDILWPPDISCMIPDPDNSTSNDELLTWLLIAQWERRFEHLLKAIVVSRRLHMPLFGIFPASNDDSV